MSAKECLLVDNNKDINLNPDTHFNGNISFQPTLHMPNLNINTTNGEYFCGPLIMIIKELAIKHLFR